MRATRRMRIGKDEDEDDMPPLSAGEPAVGPPTHPAE
jgi:hypothetical protein